MRRRRRIQIRRLRTRETPRLDLRATWTLHIRPSSVEQPQRRWTEDRCPTILSASSPSVQPKIPTCILTARTSDWTEWWRSLTKVIPGPSIHSDPGSGNNLESPIFWTTCLFNCHYLGPLVAVLIHSQIYEDSLWMLAYMRGYAAIALPSPSTFYSYRTYSAVTDQWSGTDNTVSVMKTLWLAWILLRRIKGAYR